MSVNEMIKKVDNTYLNRLGYPQLSIATRVTCDWSYKFQIYKLMGAKRIALNESDYNLKPTVNEEFALNVSSRYDYALTFEDFGPEVDGWDGSYVALGLESKSLKLSLGKESPGHQDYVNVAEIKAPPPWLHD